MSDWPSLLDSGLLASIYTDPIARFYWRSIWKLLFESRIPDTWDYQWVFVRQVNSGLTALPNCNLVQNIGFGDDATHTTGPAIDTQVRTELGAICHPRFVLADVDADRYTHDHHYGGRRHRLPLSLVWTPILVIKGISRFVRISLSNLLLN